MKQINQDDARKLLLNSGGRIFSTTFIKKDKTKRLLTGRLGVTKYLNAHTCKGMNYKTGENYGVVIGSYKTEFGCKLINVRTGFSSRISEHQLKFDRDSNLLSYTDFGYSLNGNPSCSTGSGMTTWCADKKDTIDTLASIFNVSFAKKLYELIKTTRPKPYNPSDHDLLCVFDIMINQYRMVNLNTITDLNINKKNYSIKQK
tara:strand:- start:70 stop:675 length:606 start_codon:yes stop_codon:yes gene_type:complete